MTFTERLYLFDGKALECDARVIATRPGALAFDRSCFYPGGGGQPCDQGTIGLADGDTLRVSRIETDEDGRLWHVVDAPIGGAAAGATVHLCIDRRRRASLTRYHTVLHILNTIALREYDGWITGVQIGTDYSRIDFKLEQLSASLCADLQTRVNEVVQADRSVRARLIDEGEFRQRPELRRTLDATPPVLDGQVRIVEIEGFDAQACGGTHVAGTADIGTLSIYKTENKGRINKRLYVRLGSPAREED